MPARSVLLVPDPRLKTPCAEVVSFGPNLRSLIADLEDTVAANTGCVGVAAPQIGELVRVAIVDTSGHRKFGPQSQGHIVLVNPRIVVSAGERLGREGCLSLPDFTANVMRAERVTVVYRDVTGEERMIKSEGFEAVAMQHEIDHLDGVLFLDRVANLSTDVFRRKIKE